MKARGGFRPKKTFAAIRKIRKIRVLRHPTERNSQMATKTKAIEVKVDERLAEAISDKAVKAWHATNYSNGKKRVYVTFEEVVSA